MPETVSSKSCLSKSATKKGGQIQGHNSNFSVGFRWKSKTLGLDKSTNPTFFTNVKRLETNCWLEEREL